MCSMKQRAASILDALHQKEEMENPNTEPNPVAMVTCLRFPGNMAIRLKLF